MSFWCITTFFNPAGYKTNVENYHKFNQSICKQNINLLTIEISYIEDKFWLPNSIKLKGDSVMWQKERLINYAVNLLPPDCEMYAWLDADIIYTDDLWHIKAQKLLENNDVIQLFRRVYHLPKGDSTYKKRQIAMFPGVVYQSMTEKNWLRERENRHLGFAAPGFAWAARRESFADVGIYDKDVVGSGDCILVDCLLNCWSLHGFDKKFNDETRKDIDDWKVKVQNKKLKVNYLPVDVFHLWHGDLRNRRYMQRHQSLLNNAYNPNTDIVLKNNVYEWASDKPQMHSEVKNYFYTRQEDSK